MSSPPPSPASAERKAAAVSISAELYEVSRERAKERGFTNWSAYVVDLIRKDLATGGGLNLVQEEVVTYYANPPAAVGEEVTLQSLNRKLEALDEQMKQGLLRMGLKGRRSGG